MFYCRFCVLTIISSLLLTGCMVGPNFCSPAAPDTDRYTPCPMPCKTVSARTPGGKAQQFLFYADIPGEWWELFHSPELNQLILRALCNSPNMAAAQAALRQAQQNWHYQVGVGFFPQVSGDVYAEREKFAGTSLGIPRDSEIFNLFNVNVNVTYTLDIWGGIRRQVEAAAAQVDYQYYELEATYLTLTANIVTTAIAIASFNAQIEATHYLIAIQENQLSILKKQFHLGGIALTNVLQQQTQLAQLRATLPPLEKSLAQNRHALAVLIGELPSEACLPDFHLDCLHLPTELPVSLPSLLVRQRPDVQAFEALLHVASAQIGVATANLLPQITLTGMYGTLSNQLSGLFKSDTIQWSYMAELTQPIFEAGALTAKRRQAIAAYDQAAAQYRQTVLTAFQNVADSLRAIELDAKTLKANATAEASALGTLKLTQKQFQLGGISYLTLLIAQQQYQQTVLSRVQAQAARYADTAALFQSLGGGWWNRCFTIEPPEETIHFWDWL